MEGRQWHFMHDNAPTHSDRRVQGWIAQKRIPLIVMPPYSPDLNPIENLWPILKRKVSDRYPKTLDELQDAVNSSARQLSVTRVFCRSRFFCAQRFQGKRKS